MTFLRRTNPILVAWTVVQRFSVLGSAGLRVDGILEIETGERKTHHEHHLADVDSVVGGGVIV